MVGPSDIRNIPNKILGNFHSHVHARTLKRNERFEPRRAAAWKKGEMECFYDFFFAEKYFGPYVLYSQTKSKWQLLITLCSKEYPNNSQFF